MTTIKIPLMRALNKTLFYLMCRNIIREKGCVIFKKGHLATEATPQSCRVGVRAPVCDLQSFRFRNLI